MDTIDLMGRFGLAFRPVSLSKHLSSLLDMPPATLRPHNLLLLAAVSLGTLHGQFLLVDRGPKTLAELSGPARFVGEPHGSFPADRFHVGATGEVWVIDRVRLWGQVEGTGRIGDRFEKIQLLGGLEAEPLAPGQADCDCHKLVALQTASLQKGLDTAAGQDVKISRPNAAIWQLDFEHLNWSVPGGVEIQFGVAGVERVARDRARGWSEYMVRTAAQHQVNIFDTNGKLLRPYKGAMDPSLGFAVQVWGHLPAEIEIRPRGELWEVRLHSGANLDAAHAERAGFHFGPKSAPPVAVYSKDTDLVLSFRAADTGIRAGDLNACLTGRRQDGVPFEGCDLLKRSAR